MGRRQGGRENRVRMGGMPVERRWLLYEELRSATRGYLFFICVAAINLVLRVG